MTTSAFGQHGPEAPAAGRHQTRDRLLPWIAAERTIRAIVLIAIGIALLTHTHTHWGGWFSHLSRSLGFDPGDNTLGRITGKLNDLTPAKIASTD